MTAGFCGMGSQLLFGGLIRYGGRWVPVSWVFGPPEAAAPLPMIPEMGFGFSE